MSKPLEQWEKEFDRLFPGFEGIGAPYPLFKDTPNRNRIKKFIRGARCEAVDQTLEQLIIQCDDPATKIWINEAKQSILTKYTTKEKQ